MISNRPTQQYPPVAIPEKTTRYAPPSQISARLVFTRTAKQRDAVSSLLGSVGCIALFIALAGWLRPGHDDGMSLIFAIIGAMLLLGALFAGNRWTELEFNPLQRSIGICTSSCMVAPGSAPIRQSRASGFSLAPPQAGHSP